MAVGGRAAAVAGLLLIASIAEIGVVAPRAPAAGDDQVARPASVPAETVPAETVPVLGDFDGDGRGDLLWYGPGAADDHLWLGRPSRNFVGVPVTVRGHYLPLGGDFDGDSRADVLWYGPGGAPDVLWLGRRGGRFAARTLAVRGDYRPLAGDFNGDGARDVVWYQPGPGADVVWFGHGNGRFSARRVQAPDGAEPFGGDFDGDGRRDVFWYGPGAAADRLWYGGAGGRFTTAPAAVHGSYRPLVADFGGDGPDDVLWWAPGAAGDVLWFGRGSRRFTSRWTTVDLDYQRAAALRPETLATSYNPYGFVAHAMGSVNGLLYSNSLEAFQRNLGRGFRVFECDHVLLADGTALVAHDGLEANYGLDKPFQQATWAELAGHRYRGQLTVLRSQDVLQLLADHPDVYMIPDPKYARPEIYRAYVRQAAAMGRLDLLERVMPHVADQAELDALRAYYPLRNYVLALYHSQAHNRMDDAAVVDFVRRNRVPAVMMWWRDRDPALSLAANGRQGRRYRPELTGALRAAGAVTYVHSLAGPADIQRFWDLGVGVYSDEPFPPLGAATPAVRAPAFGPSTALPPA
jgi:glycerophosphoryl diester phosphodiesterase